ncbi:MAG: flippase [Bacteroidota bacterium]
MNNYQHGFQNNYLSNSVWLLVEKISRIVSGLFVGVLVTRYLGPDQFGLISYALNVVAIFTIASTLGLDGIVVRELLIRKDKKNSILGTTFFLKLIGSVIAIICAVTYSSFHDSQEKILIVFIVGLSLLFQSFQTIDFYFQSRVKTKYTAINQLITQSISALVKIALIVLHGSVEWFAAVLVIDAIIYAIFSIYFYSKQKESLTSWKFNFLETKLLLRFSLPMIIAGFAQLLYQKADQVLILHYLNNLNFVGQYAAAIRISEAFYFIPIAISTAVFPGIINNRENVQLQYNRFIQLCSLLVWMSIGISVAGFLCGDWIISLLYAEKFNLSSLVFKIHIWSMYPVFFGTAYGMWLVAANRQRILLVAQVINLFTFLILNSILIPKYGIDGAAISIVVGSYSGLIVLCILDITRNPFVVLVKCWHPRHLIDIYRYILMQYKVSK